ncbi:MAG: response regulator transcription factor [Alphaproteobacteria bacterium]|nr:response regulator transcription factor [Rhodospirillales bacterium]MCW9046185.1 response regulator transcription factor [Alphaproteobacteria bacterium]
MRVLIVEDDPGIARQIEVTLREAGYAIDLAFDGEEGHFLGDTEPYDVIILDLGLPGIGGLNVLERWRNDGRTMPVLILSARDTWREKVTGLRTGADDYLAKPFEMDELIARVEALVRRDAGHGSPILKCGGVKLDTTSQKAFLGNTLLTLTAMEYRLLSYLMHHQEKVISKTELTEHIYEYNDDRDSNIIEVMISRLRNKIGADYIKTYRGRGYQLTADDDE